MYFCRVIKKCQWLDDNNNQWGWFLVFGHFRKLFMCVPIMENVMILADPLIVSFMVVMEPSNRVIRIFWYDTVMD